MLQNKNCTDDILNSNTTDISALKAYIINLETVNSQLAASNQHLTSELHEVKSENS